MSRPMLEPEEFDALVELAADGGLAQPERRDMLLRHLPHELHAARPAPTARDTMLSDLTALAALPPRPALLPLWIEMASQLATPRPASRELRELRDRVLHRAPIRRAPGLSVRIHAPADERGLATTQRLHAIIARELWRSGRAADVRLELQHGPRVSAPTDPNCPQILHLTPRDDEPRPSWLELVAGWLPALDLPTRSPAIIAFEPADAPGALRGEACAIWLPTDLALPFATPFYESLCAGGSIAGAFEASRAALGASESQMSLHGAPAARAAILLPRPLTPAEDIVAREARAREAIERLRGSARAGFTTAELLAHTRDPE